MAMEKQKDKSRKEGPGMPDQGRMVTVRIHERSKI